MGKRLAMVGCLALVGGGLGGCAAIESVLSWLVGADEEKKEVKPNPAVEIGVGILNTVLPGSGAVVAGLLALFADSKRRKWKAASLAQARATHRARNMKDADGKISEAALLKAQKEEQQEAKIHALLDKEIKKIEAHKKA